MSATAALDYTTSDTDPAFTIGDRLRKRRLELGLDQEQLGPMVGVSRQLVSKWERNKSLPDVAQAQRLADVLNCSFGWLCGVPLRSRWSSSFDLADGLDALGHATPQIPGQRILAFAS